MFHFIYAGYRVAWIIPLLGGVRGGFLSPFPIPRFHEDRFHEDKGREISVNISRITALPTPKSPPKRGLSKFTPKKVKTNTSGRNIARRLPLAAGDHFYYFILRLRCAMVSL